MPRPLLRLGTRRSLLARAQSGAVAARLRELHPGLDVELLGIDTRGDRVLDVPLASVEGKEFFTAEIDRALLAGEVDFAVHSFKDLSLERPPGIALAAVPRRANPRDVVLFAPDVPARLARGEPVRIGSSAPRRRENVPAFLAKALPGGAARLDWREIRGNVDSRLRRLFEPDASERRVDAVVLAFAGLARLWADTAAREQLAPLLAQVRWMVLPLDEAPAAPAQGALAVECRADDAATRGWLAPLHDAATAAAVDTERALLAKWGGGCHQRFGVTQVDAGALGALLYARGTSAAGDPLDERRWSGADPRPAGPVVAWDGTRRGRAAAVPLEGAGAEDAALGPATFVANDRALPEDWLGVAARSRLWVPGTATWLRLAARGLWVEGSAEGLGFEAVLATLQEPVLGLPALEEWTVLTHAGAVAEWAPARAVATYGLEAPAPDDVLPRATHVFWASGSQYRLCRERVPPGVHHACGPGHTARQLEHAGVAALRVFPSVREWRAWLGDTAWRQQP